MAGAVELDEYFQEIFAPGAWNSQGNSNSEEVVEVPGAPVQQFYKNILLPVTMREVYAGFDSLKTLPETDDLLAPLTIMLERLLGQEIVLCLKRNYGSLRSVFERSSPTTQCKNVIPDEPNVCWICGGVISNIPYPAGSEYENLKFECEHVFPIAQALAFTGLYEHSLYEELSSSNPTMAAAYKVGLELEYKPSHRICNQIKNDAHFIVINAHGISIDKAKIKGFLTDLSTTDKYGGWGILGEVDIGKLEIMRRADNIYVVCKQIADCVNKVSKDPVEHAKNTALHLQEYVAADSNCGMSEIIPRINPRSPHAETLSLLQLQTDITACEYALNKICNYLFGTLNPLIDPVIKSNYPARDRLKIKSTLFDKQLTIKPQIKQIVLPIMYQLRDNLMISLRDPASSLQTHRQNRTQLGVWSSYQVIMSQLIPIVVLDITRNYFTNRLHTELNSAFEEPVVQGQIGRVITDFLPFIQTFLNQNAERVYRPVFFIRDIGNIQEVYTLMNQLTQSPAPQNVANYPYFYQLSNGTVGTIVFPPRQGGGHRTRRRKRVRRRNTRHR
jgi:hypothetical protein